MKTTQEMLKGNAICFQKLSEFMRSDMDVYSWVASEIFECPYEMCLEFNKDMTKNEEGRIRRFVAKQICLNRKSIEDLSKEHSLPNLADMVIKAFPYTEIGHCFDVEELNFAKDDEIIDSYTFICAIRGYWWIKNKQSKFVEDLIEHGIDNSIPIISVEDLNKAKASDEFLEKCRDSAKMFE